MVTLVLIAKLRPMRWIFLNAATRSGVATMFRIVYVSRMTVYSKVYFTIRPLNVKYTFIKNRQFFLDEEPIDAGDFNSIKLKVSNQIFSTFSKNSETRLFAYPPNALQRV